MSHTATPLDQSRDTAVATSPPGARGREGMPGSQTPSVRQGSESMVVATARQVESPVKPQDGAMPNSSERARRYSTGSATGDGERDTLRTRHPELFDTDGLTLREWWIRRWDATTPVGRVAVVALLAVLAATVFLSAAWIVRERVYRVEGAERDRAAGVLTKLLRAQEAVRAERHAAVAVARAVWDAATPEQIEAAAPPSITAVAGGGALASQFLAAARMADRALIAAVDALLAEPHVTAIAIDEASRDSLDPAERQVKDPVLVAGQRFVLGGRATRNPAVAQDTTRIRDYVETGITKARVKRNIAGLAMWPPSGAEDGVSLRGVSYFRLHDVRDRVVNTLSLLPLDLTDAYAAIEIRIAQLAARIGTQADETRMPQVLAAAASAATSEVAAQATEAARDVLDPAYRAAVTNEEFVTRCIDFVAAADALEFALVYVLPAVNSGEAARLLWLESGRVTAQQDTLLQLRNEIVTRVLALAPGFTAASPALTDTLPGAALADALQSTLATHFAELDTDTMPTVNRFMAVTLAPLIIAVLLLVLAVAEQRHYARNVVDNARDKSMERTISYVADVGDALRRFNLEAAAQRVAAESHHATTSPGLHTVHDRLQRCVASVRHAAYSLPPLLFPERADAAATYYAVVRRGGPSGSGGNLMAEATKKRAKVKARGQGSSDTRSDAGSSAAAVGAAGPSNTENTGDDGAPRRRRVVSPDDVANEAPDEDIADRVAQELRRPHAVFLFFDLSTLLEYQTSTDALDAAREYVPILSTLAEEAITLHGGVFHGLQGYAIAGSWDVVVDAAVPNSCEAAARAAYALAARTSLLRRDDAGLRQRLTPSIAITAGQVTYAVWPGGAAPGGAPQDALSLAHVAGPPLARAAAVLRSNYHHATHIAVDDNAAEELARRELPSKPIELLATALTEVQREGGAGGGGAGGATGGAGGEGASANAAAASTNAASSLRLRSQRLDSVRRIEEASGTRKQTLKTETEGRAHELISLARHRDPDLPARLAEYKASFSLYQRGYHAEALKGFRRYTRLYGYDGSVERIQGLIMA